MSAYLCSGKHIAALAAWSIMRVDKVRSSEIRAAVIERAGLLAKENHASMQARYPEYPTGDHWYLKGGFAGHLAACQEEAGRFADEHLTPADIHNLCQCYCYQSCEHEGWPDSEARRHVHALDEAIGAFPACPVPAPRCRWEYDDGGLPEDSDLNGAPDGIHQVMTHAKNHGLLGDTPVTALVAVQPGSL